MKYFTTLLLLVCLQFTAFSSATLDGHVSDATTLEPLEGANVMIYEADKMLTGAVTDKDGYFKLELPEGTYKIEISNTNYRLHTMNNIKLKDEVNESLNIFLDNGRLEIDEVVTGGASPLASVTTSGKKKKRSMPGTFSMGSSAKKEKRSRSMSDKVMTTAPVAPTPPRSAEPAPPPPATLEISHSPETYEEVVMERIEAGSVSDAISSTGDPRVSGPEANKRPKAGQLTAGEWNDLDNWNFWHQSLTEDAYASIRDVWGMYPTTRYSVFVQNEDGIPMPNADVLLTKGGETIWAAKSDNKGKAELWANMFQKNGSIDGLKITVTHNRHSVSERRISPYGNGINTFTVSSPCKAPTNVDVMFAVDATGSMGDEINYLKSELKDVMGRIKKENEKLNIRLGSVFYRDHTDTYLTRTHPFTSSLDKISTFFNEQEAQGGGDFPEAVEDALAKAIDGQKWSKDAVARILFLVLDAPPHSGDKNIKELHRLTKKAAAQGIKIIPITASGIDRSTEFLMKMMTLSTNGTYAFLTDHSGIGGKHLKPVAESYNVETLNDLMVRVVLENVEYQDCNEDILPVVGDPNVNPADLDPNKSDADLMQDVHFFPNPAVTHIYVSLKDGVDLLTIHDGTGREVKRETNLQPGETKVSMKGLSGGTYYIRFVKDGKVVTNKLVVVQV